VLHIVLHEPEIPHNTGNIVRLCDSNGIPVKLGDYRLEDVHDAEEAFVTGTFGGVTPVREVDGHVMPLGVPGPMTAHLAKLYEALKDEQAFYAQLRAGAP
jgi:branched-chain amino acid aminotransferase